MSAAPAEYPQIRPMFSDALKAMAEGETEAEKQIVYVLNEARAALPCPAFVASGISGSRHLFVMLGGKIVSVVQVSAVAGPGFMVVSPCSDAFGAWTTEPDVLSLASDVGRALKAAHWVIMQAAAEAVPKVRTDYSAGLVTRAEAVQMFSGGFAGVSPGPVSREVAPGETVKSADVLAARALTVVESVDDTGTQWFLSFDGPNPSAEQCVQVVNRDEAFKAKRLIDSLLMR